MVWAKQQAAIFARVGSAFAALALIVNVLVPPGFMMARQENAPALVICTGHGASHLSPDRTGKDHTPSKDSHGNICACAGHGVAASPPTLDAVASSPPDRTSSRASSRADLAPGRGLAAPPPASRGPPPFI